MPVVRGLLTPLRNAIVTLLAIFTAFWRRVIPSRPVEWIVYDLHGRLERGDAGELPGWSWRPPRGARPESVAALRRELDFLRTTSIRGIVLRLRSLHSGIGVLMELRAVLATWRQSGREVVIHSDQLSLRDYWLASGAGRIWLAPRGRLELAGFASSSMAAARPLRRLGIEFDVIRAGAFKSAGELFGADEVSPEQKQQLDELIGDMNTVFIKDVADGRGRSPEEIQSAVDQGPFSARTAREAGLIDDCAYADEVRARLALVADGRPQTPPRRARLGPFKAIFTSRGAPARGRPWRDHRPAIAVLDVEGVITSGKSRAAPWMSATAGSDSLVPALTRLRLMPEVKAVVLRIDSRGGRAAPSDLIWRAAKRLNEVKPVIAFLDDVAASGGYYIAAAARRILAAPTCVTGSIGVFMLRPNFAGALDKLEIDRATVRRGARATLYRTDHALTEDERQVLQEQVKETYDDFVRVVAEGRRMTEDRVRSLAEGRVYLATRAREIGLVDALGTLDDALLAAREAADVPGTARTLWWHATPTGWREIVRMLRDGTEERAMNPDPIQALWTGEMPS
jgi:protease-4